MTKEKQEALSFEFSFKISKKKNSYDSDTIIKVDFKEALPHDVDHIKYVKSRIAEEINRQKRIYDSYLDVAVEPKDPLTDDVNF